MTDDFKTIEYEEIYHIVAKNNRLTVNSAKHLKLLSGSFGGGSFKGIIECKFCCGGELSAFFSTLIKTGVSLVSASHRLSHSQVICLNPTFRMLSCMFYLCSKFNKDHN